MNSLLFLALILSLASCAIGRRDKKPPEPDMELTMHWRDLSLKTICEEEEWKAQLEPVKEKFAKCLGLRKLVIDDNDPDGNVDRYSMFKSDNNNPYCRISKSWEACTHYLKALNCIEPNGDEVKRQLKGGLSQLVSNSKRFDPDDMNSMAKAYQMQCEMAKFASHYSPFGGHGMDYYGGMGMDYPDMGGTDGGEGDGEGEVPELPHDGDF